MSITLHNKIFYLLCIHVHFHGSFQCFWNASGHSISFERCFLFPVLWALERKVLDLAQTGQLKWSKRSGFLVIFGHYGEENPYLRPHALKFSASREQRDETIVNSMFLVSIQLLGYKDSNLEMTESESVALPFGDSPSHQRGLL